MNEIAKPNINLKAMLTQVLRHNLTPDDAFLYTVITPDNIQGTGLTAGEAMLLNKLMLEVMFEIRLNRTPEAQQAAALYKKVQEQTAKAIEIQETRKAWENTFGPISDDNLS